MPGAERGRPPRNEPRAHADSNTLLLYDSPELGICFQYPAAPRVASVNGRQITLDENRGSGLLITLETSARLPAAEQFLSEVRTGLTEQKGVRASPRKLPCAGPGAALDQFSLEVDMNKQRAWLEYYVVRQSHGGACLPGCLIGADANGTAARPVSHGPQLAGSVPCVRAAR